MINKYFIMPLFFLAPSLAFGACQDEDAKSLQAFLDENKKEEQMRCGACKASSYQVKRK